jgi:glycosyltransferase involved in cell wall biosynthesis
LFLSADATWETSMLTRFSIDSKAVRVTCVARLTTVKNHRLLLDAWSVVARSKLPHAMLLLVGDGPLREELEELVRLNQLSESVRFLGWQPNSPSVYSISDVAVLTSDSEGFPNSLVEGMACGCPVIATDVGGVRDAVSERVGILIPRGDRCALIEALQELITNKARRDLMANEARSTALRAFSRAHAVAALERAYV